MRDIQKFQTFLTEDLPQNVFRAKGLLWFSDSNFRHIFQLSGLRYQLDADEWKTQPKNQLVLIGKHLDNSKIHSLLMETNLYRHRSTHLPRRSSK